MNSSAASDFVNRRLFLWNQHDASLTISDAEIDRLLAAANAKIADHEQIIQTERSMMEELRPRIDRLEAGLKFVQRAEDRKRRTIKVFHQVDSYGLPVDEDGALEEALQKGLRELQGLLAHRATGIKESEAVIEFLEADIALLDAMRGLTTARQVHDSAISISLR